MNNLFVSYDIALKLKERGFDETCFRVYDSPYSMIPESEVGMNISNVDAPTIQQVVDWLDEQKGVLVQVEMDITGSFYYRIGSLHPESAYQGDWVTSPYVYNRKLAWTEGITHALKLI